MVHVDDGIAASNKKSVLVDIGTHLGSKFIMHTVPPTRYIGLNISRDQPNKRVFIFQSHIIEKLSSRFGMSKMIPKTIPADPSIRLIASKCPKSEGEKTTSPYPYREAVGALLYLALMTRPDISYAVGQVSKYCQNPNESHWNAVTQIFAYLNGTMDFGIWLGGERTGLIGYTDADFAGDKSDYRSTSGSIFFFHGGPVSWSSKKQSCTALSTTEAEYIAACEATKTAVWLSCLLQDFSGTDQQRSQCTAITKAPFGWRTTLNSIREQNMCWFDNTTFENKFQKEKLKSSTYLLMMNWLISLLKRPKIYNNAKKNWCRKKI